MRTTTLDSDGAEMVSVIHQALDLGATLIDTADVYGPYTNEELVGRALAGDHRERAVLATKVSVLAQDRVVTGLNVRPEHIRRSIDESLGRLRTGIVPIPGTKTPKYLQDNARAADLELTAADLAELDALPAPTGGRSY